MKRPARRLKPGLLLLLGAVLALALVQPAARSAPFSDPAPVQPLPAPAAPAAGSAAPPADQRPELASLLLTVVRVEVQAARDAESADSLGARRSGTGVLLDPNTVLTIGYLLLEADQ